MKRRGRGVSKKKSIAKIRMKKNKKNKESITNKEKRKKKKQTMTHIVFVFFTLSQALDNAGNADSSSDESAFETPAVAIASRKAGSFFSSVHSET